MKFDLLLLLTLCAALAGSVDAGGATITADGGTLTTASSSSSGGACVGKTTTGSTADARTLTEDGQECMYANDEDDEDDEEYDDEDDIDLAMEETEYQASSPGTIGTSKVSLEDKDYGEVQEVYDETTLNIVLGAREYMTNDVYGPDSKIKPSIRDSCRNTDKLCAFWASIGECEKNPAYMQVNCGPVCKSCHMLDIDLRCPMDPNAIDAVPPGYLNQMFERIITDPWYKQYEPIVLSRPTLAPGDTMENKTYGLGLWLVMFDNAMSDDEADRMIELGTVEGYKRSTGVGSLKADGTYIETTTQARTSSNAWCNEKCYEDPIAQRLMSRVENITGIPEPNHEYFQLLRYEPNEYYRSHSDYIAHQRDRPQGVRVLTFYFYLNDVEEGGGTQFPKLGMTVTPKKGRAVLWPSVYDHEPNKKDPRSDHEAMPVIKGVKYGCNAWIHMRDFKTPNNKGC